MSKVKVDNTNNEAGLYVGMFVKLKRKTTFFNPATIVNRRIRSIDRENKKILCDDNIDYKFSQLLWK